MSNEDAERERKQEPKGKGNLPRPAQAKLEVNLLKQPFFALSTKQLPKLYDRALKERRPQIGYEEYEGSVKRVWWVSPDLRLGYCGPFDKKVFMLVQQMLLEVGPPFPRYFRLGSLYELCRRLKLHDSGRNKQLIKEALMRIGGCRIYSENTFYLKGEGRYWYEPGPGEERESPPPLHPKGGPSGAPPRPRALDSAWGSFTLWQVYGRGRKLPDGTKTDALYLELNVPFLSSLESFYVKPIDFEYYESLRNPVTQRLYELLGVKFYGLQDSPYVKISYTKLCRLLPLTPQRHLSRARQQLETAHDRLVRTGFLREVEWQIVEGEPARRRVLRELGESPWLLVYYPGRRALEEIRRLGLGRGREARPEELWEPEAQAAAEAEGLKAELLSVLGDVHSQAFYGKLARRAQEEPRLKELIYRCLSEVKEEAHEGRIRTTKGAVFVDKLKRYCRERGIKLGLRAPKDHQDHRHLRPRDT